MADHIKINTTLLREMGSSLGRLRDEFTHSTDITGAAKGDMGSGDVADALNNFASDWSKKRDELTKGLDTLSKTATGSADHWERKMSSSSSTTTLTMRSLLRQPTTLADGRSSLLMG